MSFPYIFSSSFDTGDNSEWTSEHDGESLLDFPHYSELARLPGYPAPYRGAYCMRVQLSDAEEHTVTAAAIDIADTVTRHTRFALFISPDFAATANDIFNIFEWQGTADAVESAISLQIVAATDAVTIAVGDGAAAASGFTPLSKGVWHIIEALFTVGTGGAGVLTLFVDGAQVQTATSLTTNTAILQGTLGVQDALATTTGYLLFDEFAFDDTRLALPHRFATHRLLSRSAFMFVGPGRIDNIKLLDGGSGDVTLELYDTDVYTASMTPIFRDRTATANVNVDAADVPIDFVRGCLAVLGGTLPGAVLSVCKAVGWGSDGAIRSYASRRVAGVGGL